MKILKDLTDQFVMLIACWMSISLTFFQGSFFPDDASRNPLLYGLFGLFLLNVIVLMWLWFRFTRKKRRAKQ